MTVTSGVIQLGCAAWVAETMLSQEAMKDVAEPGYRYPFGAGALSGTEYGDWSPGVGTNGSKRYRSTSRRAQPSNFKWIVASSRVALHNAPQVAKSACPNAVFGQIWRAISTRMTSMIKRRQIV